MSRFEPTIPHALAESMREILPEEARDEIIAHVDLRNLTQYKAMKTLAQYLPYPTAMEREHVAYALLNNQKISTQLAEENPHHRPNTPKGHSTTTQQMR